MKKNIFRLLIFVPVFSACEKVIDVDLNSADPKIVIAAAIADVPGDYTVKLTRTVNFDESSVFPTVSDALVKMSDDAGNSEVLNETSPGIYSITSLQGIPGRTYTLEVTVDGKVYTAISKMPLPVNIDSLIFEGNAGGLFGEVPYVVSARFQDPSGIDNFYRLSQFVQTGQLADIFIDDDRLQDGSTIIISRPIALRRGIPGLGSGDSVKVLLQAIDKNVYEYLRTLNELEQEGILRQASSPANPSTNFSNGALGYFNAYSETSKVLVIQ